MPRSIAGRTAIVTGATRGIGRGIARVLASEGANLVLVSRRAEDGEKAIAEMTEAGGRAIHVAADVTDWQAMQGVVAEAEKVYGGIDILCANAGIFPQARIADLSPEDWDHVQAVNLKGTFLGVKACLPAFVRRGQGRVIVTSSITGPITGYPGWTHYGASKAGQLGFIRTAAIELAKHKVTVNAVLPGNVVTEGLEGLGQDYLDTMAASIPLGRLGSVEDIGHAVLFLASDEAGYITGQTIVVDGGQTLPESLEALQSA